MILKSRQIEKKWKTISTFIPNLRFHPSSEENRWKMSYELKCGQLSSTYLLAVTVQRQTELIFKKLAYVLHISIITSICVIRESPMLTRRDVLTELKRMGVRKLSLLKSYSRDFEKYIGNHYSFEILKTKKELDSLPGLVSESRHNKLLYS